VSAGSELVAPDAAALEGRQLAALDLGSNSFHLVVARVDGGGLHVIDRLRETVRLAAGLDDRKYLVAEAMVRALACLERFAERLRGMAPGTVRAVGTNTLRSARNGERFRARAEQVLGHPIEVIAGREEARLIYSGVVRGIAASDGRRLVADIGGGSTELIIGEGLEPSMRESLYMGCVGMSRRFFPGGTVERRQMKAAVLAAGRELEPITARFRACGWDSAIGCSGTIKALAGIARAEGWCRFGITREALRKLRHALIDAGSVTRVQLRELRPDRREVLPGGVAVLSAIFKFLDLDRMTVSDAALREGLLFDLLGRIRHQDVRAHTVDRMAERFGVDRDQAARVERVARIALEQLPPLLGVEAQGEEMLAWAARLHEIGLALSHAQHHKHGAYLLANADLAGFSRQEQAMLAALVRGHRRKFPGDAFNQLPKDKVRLAIRLCVVLRLAVLLERGRGNEPTPAFGFHSVGQRVELSFPPGWLAAHPLTEADLAEERAYLDAVGIRLSVS